MVEKTTQKFCSADRLSNNSERLSEQIKAIDPKERGCNRVDMLSNESIMMLSDKNQCPVIKTRYWHL